MAQKHYDAPEVALAMERFKEVTGRNVHAFLNWIGFGPPWDDDIAQVFPTQFLVQVGMTPHTKMEILMNNHHYHALLKASLAKEEQNEQ